MNSWSINAIDASWNDLIVSFQPESDGLQFANLREAVEKSEGSAWWRMISWKCLCVDKSGKQIILAFRIDAEPDFDKVKRLLEFMRETDIDPECVLAWCQWKGTWDPSVLNGGRVMSLSAFADGCGSMGNVKKILESGKITLPDGRTLGIIGLTSDGANILQDDGYGKLIIPSSLDPSVPKNFVIGDFSCDYPDEQSEQPEPAHALIINIFLGGAR